MINYATYQGFKDPKVDRSELLDARGATKTELLFHERMASTRRKSYTPLYTLKENTYTCPRGNTMPSAYQIYMHSVDETDAALKLVGSLRHWRRLLHLNWFMEGDQTIGFEGLNQWREDKRALDASLARRALQQEAYVSGNVTAARTLLQESTKGDVGRPRKAAKSVEKASAKAEEQMVSGIRARLDLQAGI